MAENLAYHHIKVTQQTRVNGLGSSGQCAQSEQYWRTETTETDPPEHTALLRCLGWHRSRATRCTQTIGTQLTHSGQRVTVLPHGALLTAAGHHCHVAAASVVSLAAGPSVSRTR